MKQTSISRAQFLRGDFSGRHPVIRPPWSIPEPAFVDHCIRCDACIDACETDIVVRGRGGFPEIDFRRGECTFCHACARVCQPGVIADQGQTVAWHLTPRIEERCLARQGVVCATCQEQCENEAIRLRPAAGRVPQPVVDAACCNGCGACVRPCPAQAIVLQTHKAHSPAQPQEAHA